MTREKIKIIILFSFKKGFVLRKGANRSVVQLEFKGLNSITKLRITAFLPTGYVFCYSFIKGKYEKDLTMSNYKKIINKCCEENK